MVPPATSPREVHRSLPLLSLRATPRSCRCATGRSGPGLPLLSLRDGPLGPAPGYALGMQGVIKNFDPGTGDGVLISEADLSDIDLAEDALEGSVFRMLRQGQRVQFDLDESGRATALRLGSEIDMATPDL